MNLEDLKVGLDVVIVSAAHVRDNMDQVNGGYQCRVSRLFFSQDMIERICGKKVRITEIDNEDPNAPIMAGGFWMHNSWIDKIYVKPAPRPKPVADPNKPKRFVCPSKAQDGTAFGPVLKKFIRAHREFKDLSTNRISRLTPQEHEQICAIYDIEYNVANANLFNDIFEAMVNE